ncbi:MAG: hypothetical protein K2Y01_04850 [Rhabdochlamydiaceae bacterium]|nr:hypothetical protein [Rhabdochlamydiaceae bacterium]
MKKLLLTPLLFTCIAYADSSYDNETIIPEGKLIDYPSIYHDVTPSAGPRVIDGCGVFLTGDYIYWTARQDNMAYASTGFTNNNLVSTGSGSTAEMKYKFRTGFKAGLGFSFGHDYWDSSFNYTWFQSNHNKGSVQGGEGSGLTPSFSPYITLAPTDYFTSASAVWRLHFNVIDWELGRNFYISKFLSLRPFTGLKGTWQNQHNNSAYSGIISSDPFQYTRKMKNSFMGVGIRSGCNMGWHIAGTWSLFGDVAVSALWGQFHTHRTDTANLPTATVTPVSFSNQIHTASPVLELALGLRKDQWFYNNRFHFSAQAGWEEQIWFNQNQFSWNNSLAPGGNLVLQGLTVRLRFDF